MYFLFANYEYENLGGMGDYKGAFDEVSVAKHVVEETGWEGAEIAELTPQGLRTLWEYGKWGARAVVPLWKRAEPEE